MSFTTVPTPMYALYQARDGFPTVMITVIFAAYGFGVMGGLYFAGHLSDYLGRRPIALAALLFELVSCLIFLFFKDEAALLVARFVCGVGIGAITSTATAHLAELRGVHAPHEHGRVSSLVAGAVNTGGLALGPLFGGLLVQYLGAPLTTPFALYLVALVVIFTVVLLAPETVTVMQPRPAYRPQKVQVDPSMRGQFTAAAIAAGGAFSVMGFFTALTGSVLGRIMHEHSPLVTGLAVFATMAASSMSQVALFSVSPRRKLWAGMIAMVVGLAGMAVGGLLASIWVFCIGGVCAGAGMGLVFASAIAAANRMADPARRSETVAGMFLAAYAGITVPVIACGVLLIWVPTVDLLVAFSIVIILVAVASTSQMLRHTPR